MKRLTYLVARPEKPLDVSTIHDGPLCAGSPLRVNGIRTKIGEHLLRAGALSSPFQVLPCPDCGTKTQYHELTCPRRARAKNLA